jgi:hypothetical protein
MTRAALTGTTLAEPFLQRRSWSAEPFSGFFTADYPVSE